MKYIKQAILILLLSLLGELLHYFISLPIPASIYGMLILFICLCSGIIKIQQIKTVSSVLLEIMPMLFIPSAVGIMSQFDQLKSIWIQIVIITIFSTISVMAISGRVTQAIIVHQNKEAATNEQSPD